MAQLMDMLFPHVTWEEEAGNELDCIEITPTFGKFEYKSKRRKQAFHPLILVLIQSVLYPTKKEKISEGSYNALKCY